MTIADLVKILQAQDQSTEVPQGVGYDGNGYQCCSITLLFPIPAAYER